ncbi:MAG: hypothetical protein HC803_11705 [Saprospiraceae bacterium]|nr:hypothetical protein [Saprospiraceae bacterium]
MGATNKRVYSRSWRSRKAYWTAIVVAMRYLRLFLLEKVFGRRYYENRIMAVHVKNAHYIKKNDFGVARFVHQSWAIIVYYD